MKENIIHNSNSNKLFHKNTEFLDILLIIADEMPLKKEIIY